MINVIPARCQPYLYEKAKCRLCIDVCPVEGCISFNDRAVSVKTEDCIGCGICTNVCPTSALVFNNLSDRELLNRLNASIKADDKDVVFGCSLAQNTNETGLSVYSTFNIQHSTLINLPCLAILKESHLISLILSGIQNIYLDLARCSECSFKHGKKTIERTIFYARNMLDAIGKHDCIKYEVCKKGDEGKAASRLLTGKNRKNKTRDITPEPEYSRRELLSFFRAKAVEKAVERVTGVKNEKIKKGGAVEEQDVFERRKILLDALKGNNALQSAQVEEGMFPVHHIKIKSNCTLCRVCSLFCPTSALTRVEGNKEVRIDFNAAFCMGCYECKELCPEDVIDKQGAIDINRIFNNEVKTIFKKKTEVCPSCGKTFFPEHGIEECLICRKKNNMDEIFFGALFKNPDMQENKQTIGGER